MKSVETDRASGAVFVALAGLFAVPAFSYGMGSFARLGAGVFPLAVSILLGLVGVALILRSFAGEGDKVLPFDLRAMVFIVAGMLFGAFGLNRFGLVVAVPGAVILASFASRERRPVGVLVAAAVLTLIAWLVFVAGLGVRLPLVAGL
ncbi:tripartite tricarboxylate transporter TctB family protein [Hoeflea sp. 108]|uniref:tripartite tricarboxylate transporter TctB family protein n=1 Tax=Hoeflea sp. 108 TaxID=1116369 RepID=UPI00035D6E9F|nr:tripartite tricarboxylate transporter TctB family protein [Hoeflea sp. 108]